jgi:autotransporter-associated beta strand protein
MLQNGTKLGRVSSRTGRRRSAIVAAAAAVCGLWSLPHGAGAQTYNWQTFANDTWSDPAAWDAGTFNGSSSTTVNFGVGTTNAAQYISTLDLPSTTSAGSILINSLNLATNAPGDNSNGTISIVPVNSGTLQTTINLTGTNPTLNFTGAGVASITTGISYGNGAVVTNNGSGYLFLGSGTAGYSRQVFNGSNTFINNNTGTLDLVDADSSASYSGGSINLTLINNNPTPGSFGAPNFASNVSGTITIQTGYVQFQGNTGGDLFGNSLILNVDAGATFDFNGNGESMGGITGAGNVTGASVNFFEPGNRTFNGVFSGTMGVGESNYSVLYLGGNNTFTGGTTISFGEDAATVANAFSPNSTIYVWGGDSSISFGGLSQTIAGLVGGASSDQINVGSGNTVNISDNSTSARIYEGGISGAGNLTYGLNGASGVAYGTQYLQGSNTFTGALTVNNGTLLLGVPFAPSSITVGSSATFGIFNTGNFTATTAITGGGTLLTLGGGTVTLNQANSGATLAGLIVNGGSFVLDDTTNNGGQLGTVTPALAVDSAALYIKGNGSAPSSHSFTAYTPTGGGTISVTSGSGQSTTLNLGAINRNLGGGGVNFLTTNTGSGSAIITTTTANTSGIIGDYAVNNGTSWATATGSTSPYTVGSLSTYTANTFVAGNHTDVQTAADSILANTTTYDVRFNQNVADTISLAGASTLTGGGILVTPNVGAITDTIKTGSINVATGTDLIVNQYDHAGTLNISSVIQNTVPTSTVQYAGTIAASGGSQVITVSSTAGLSLGMTVTDGTEIPASYNAKVVGILSPTAVQIAYITTPTAATSQSLNFTSETDVIKTGTGTLQLSGSNKFGGLLALYGGDTVVSGTSGLGATTYSGSTGSQGTSAIYFDGGTLETTGNLSPGTGLQPWIIGPNGGTIQIDGSAAKTVTRTGYGLYGTGTLSVVGSGTFDVGSNGSPFTGTFNIGSGICYNTTSSQLGSTGDVTVQNGGQYAINDDDPSGTFNFGPYSILSITGDGPAFEYQLGYPGALVETIQSGPTAAPISTIANEVYLAGNFARLGQYAGQGGYVGSTILSGLVTGPGALIKDGVGTLTLTGIGNNYGSSTTLPAATIISEGVLNAGTTNCLPTTGVLQFGESNASDGSLSSNNSGTFDMRGYSTVTGGLTTASTDLFPQNLISTSTGLATLTVNYLGATAAQFTGSIGNAANNSNIAVVIGGTGEQQFQGSSTYTAGTTVNSGTLTGTVAGAFGVGTVTVSPTGTAGTVADNATVNVNADGAIGTTAAVTLSSEASDGGFGVAQINFNDPAPVIGSLSGSGKALLANPLSSGGTNLTLGSTGSATFSGVISDLGTGNGSITVTGSGTVVLAGTNTFGGSTTVNSGTLDVTGSVASSGAINVAAVNAPATLVLDGTNAVSAVAPINLSTTGTGTPELTVNSSQSLGAITSVGTSNFAAGTSTVASFAGAGTLVVASTATVNATNALNHGAILSAGTINVNGGTTNLVGTINDVSVGQTGVLNVNTGANLTVAPLGHIVQGAVNIASGSTVTVSSNPNGAFNPTSTTPNPSTSVINDLYNNGGSTSLTSGTLDLKNNALIVNDPNQASSIIAAVYHAADFNPSSGSNQWDQPGITSSSAAANAGTYALGSLTGPELTNLGSTTFQGLPVTSNSTVVAYTLIGDTELRGTVDGTDYNNVLANYDTAGDWSQGNFYNESIVSGDDYNAVLNAYDVAAAGGAKGLKPAVTRALSPAVPTGSPVATSGTFHLEVNTTSGDVTLFNDSTSSAPLTLYNIVDGSQQDLLIGNPADGNGTSTSINSGSAPYTNEHFLSVAQNDSNAVASITGRSSTNYKAWSLVLDGYNSNATALALSEGGQANKTDTINVPSYYSIDLGDIFNVGTTTVALTFQWGTETSSGGEGGTVYSNQPIDYVGTPEPASLGLLGLGGLAMMRRRRKASR